MKTLILCNGTPPSRALFERYKLWADYFIAADGGGNIARSFNCLPDIVVGDLDSFEGRETDEFQVVYDPDQETNDLEKALSLAKEEGAGEVTVLGATGRRLDHTLKNLSVLKQFNDAFEKIIFRDDYGDAALLPREFSSAFSIGTILSLFPLSGVVTGITTEGLKYELQEGTLENGVRDGSSNEVIASPVSVSHKEGDLLIFVAR